MGWADIGSLAFLAAGKTHAGFVLCGLSGDGQSLFTVPLPVRGHAAAGTLLLTSEVMAQGSAGRTGLWDTSICRRIGEWDSGGIGPQDIRRLSNGRILVAKGGIQTDPSDRAKLNLATMRSNLTVLSATEEM
jgi:hypothetical protein